MYFIQRNCNDIAEDFFTTTYFLKNYLLTFINQPKLKKGGQLNWFFYRFFKKKKRSYCVFKKQKFHDLQLSYLQCNLIATKNESCRAIPKQRYLFPLAL